MAGVLEASAEPVGSTLSTDLTLREAVWNLSGLQRSVLLAQPDQIRAAVALAVTPSGVQVSRTDLPIADGLQTMIAWELFALPLQIDPTVDDLESYYAHVLDCAAFGDDVDAEVASALENSCELLQVVDMSQVWLEQIQFSLDGSLRIESGAQVCPVAGVAGRAVTMGLVDGGLCPLESTFDGEAATTAWRATRP